MDPWAPARIDRAAWETAKAIIEKKARSQDFDATRGQAPQSLESMATEAAKIRARFPGRMKKENGAVRRNH